MKVIVVLILYIPLAVCELCIDCREVKVTESSESVLAGTKRPPFRLVVRAVHESGQRLDIRPAVSEEFVVSPALRL